jgi:hypothetical protein
VMSKAVCKVEAPENKRRQQKTHPGVIRRWVSGAVKSL